jgi:glutamate:GABA antiporter
MATAASDDSPSGQFIKSLGAADVASFVIVSVVTLRWIPRAASAGWPSVTLWCLAALLFFMPLTMVVRELSARFPEQGGLYVWVHRAFGPRHSFFCAWCLWLNQIFYFPSYLLFALANFFVLAGPHSAGLATNRPLTAALVLAGLWALTLLNIRGFELAKWMQSLGTLAIWVPVGLLFAAAVLTLARGATGTPFSMHDLLPRGGSFTAFALWSSMCFAFSGFEIAGFVGQEIRNPARSIPIGLALAGAAILFLYLGGSSAILLVTPASHIDERTGIGDAIQSAMHSPYAGNFVALLMAVATIAATSSWMAGAARVPYAVAVEGRLPASLKNLHSRYKTPYVALVAQALFASLALLVSLFLNVDNKSTSVQEAYDVLVNLSIFIYFVPYIYLFVSPLVLGARTARWRGVAITGTLTTFASIVLLFVPPAGTNSVLTFETSLILQSGAVLAGGLLVDKFYKGREA